MIQITIIATWEEFWTEEPQYITHRIQEAEQGDKSAEEEAGGSNQETGDNEDYGGWCGRVPIDWKASRYTA